ncbi:hypothetical protein Taro_054042 [Colocasia esculenta]|uniref:Uncharacterized protein n=1 Tax=Colocasia esculenta TaxID=4460 RepID=A0A843XPE1_COLES|nr:hypothetical protein [Colocasia esculenta]
MCSAQGRGHCEGDAQGAGRSRGNARRSLHSVFFVKVDSMLRFRGRVLNATQRCAALRIMRRHVVDAYRGYLSSWVPQVLLTSEAHPYSPQVRARRRFLYRRPVRSRDVAAVVMADRRDWGGRRDDPEESTQRMIERIWESLTDIRTRMDQQAPVPPVTGEEVPVAPVLP